MSAHTPGPWIASPFGDCAFEILDRNGAVIVEIDGPPENSELIEASARRIVQCVNACEGIADPASLRSQRDELLAVLRDALDWNKNDIRTMDEITPDEAMLKARHKVLRAAIAKVEGRS